MDSKSMFRRRGAASAPVWALALALMLPAPPAHAYIDPGSGSFLLQMILAGFAGAAFYCRDAITRALRKILGRERTSRATEASKPRQQPRPDR